LEKLKRYIRKWASQSRKATNIWGFKLIKKKALNRQEENNKVHPVLKDLILLNNMEKLIKR
jgi:hypothetical protein